MNCSLANWSCLLDGRGCLFEDFVGCILLSNYLSGCLDVILSLVFVVFLAVIQVMAFPSHVDLSSLSHEIFSSYIA